MDNSYLPDRDDARYSISSIINELIADKKVFADKTTVDHWLKQIRECIGVDFSQFKTGKGFLLTENEKVFISALLMECQRPYLKRVLKGGESKETTQSDLVEAEEFHRNMMAHGESIRDEETKSVFQNVVEQLSAYQLKQTAADIVTKLKGLPDKFKLLSYEEKLKVLSEAHHMISLFESRLQTNKQGSL